jgi:solute carrier family 45 protein 1/2/4
MSSVFLCQLAWFPFLLFDTDWMGREVYQGSPQGNKALANLNQLGVRGGALGLLLQSVSVSILGLPLSGALCCCT